MKWSMRLAICAVIAIQVCTSCTMFSKNQPSDEMEKLTEDVLKKNEGVDIRVMPVDRTKA